MTLAIFDYFIFSIFILYILYIIIHSLSQKKSAENYFKAGGHLRWFSIGMSLLAADLSIGYIIGSSGVGFEKGLAVGSYGWTASIVMIFVALYILPKFMRVGVQTLPEYLELRYSPSIRLAVAIIMVVVNAIAGLPSMYYSSAILIEQTFGINHIYFYWIIIATGIVTSGIILSGGLSAVVRTNILVASLALIGGLTVVIFCFIKVGGFDNFMLLSQNKVHSVLPADDKFLPWTQVFLGSLWLMHLNYWAFNQSVIQNVLVSRSLSEAQFGMLFAATIKLFVPFLFVVPGIIGFELFSAEITKPDHVFPIILREIIPVGLKGFVLIAFTASVLGVSNALLNATATIFTNDIYKRFINKNTSDEQLIRVSRITIVCTIIVAILSAPLLDDYQHIFYFSQQVRSMVVPAILGIFILGLFSYRTPVHAAILALLLCIPNFFILKKIYPELPKNDVLGISFLVIGALMVIIRLIKPLEVPINLPGNRNIRFERNLIVMIWSIFIITIVTSIYVIFL